MPGFFLHVGAQVNCQHMGKAEPTAPDPRVTVSGQPITTLPTQYMVSGCPNPGNAGGPCVTAQFTSSATRVLAGGKPVLLFDSLATCTPTGVPTQTVTTQTRVKGT